MDKLSFTLKFVFEEKDEAKVLELREALKSFGVVSNASLQRDGVKHKKDRFRAILKAMDYGEEYSTGKLWARCSRFSTSGKKTFQRDLNSMVVLGFVNGKLIRPAPSGKGQTVLWSKNNIYGGDER